MTETERLTIEYLRKQVEELSTLLEFARQQIRDAHDEIEHLKQTLKAQSSINQLYLGMLEANLDANS